MHWEEGKLPRPCVRTATVGLAIAKGTKEGTECSAQAMVSAFHDSPEQSTGTAQVWRGHGPALSPVHTAGSSCLWVASYTIPISSSLQNGILRAARHQ